MAYLHTPGFGLSAYLNGYQSKQQGLAMDRLLGATIPNELFALTLQEKLFDQSCASLFCGMHSIVTKQ